MLAAVAAACFPSLAQNISGPTLEREIEKSQSSETTKFKRAMTGEELQAQSRMQQQNARGIVQGVIAPPNNAPRTFDGAVYEQEAVRQKQNNQRAIAATSEQLVEETKSQLPKFDQIGGQLKYGEHVIVSKEGGEIIALIRSLTSPQTQRSRALAKLQEFARQGKPEAINFLGFASEYGLYGARKDAARALGYYQSAAEARYQPALFNLALGFAYGRFGAADPSKGLLYSGVATTITNDPSGRVCGLASFLAFRLGKQELALQHAKGCASPLAHLARAAYTESQSLPVRVEWLRDAITTGANDGFGLIMKIAQPVAKSDRNATYCKYVLVTKYFNAQKVPPLRKDAEACIDATLKQLAPSNEILSMRETMVSGVSAFAPFEIMELKKRRAGNKFHFAWSVPYLPFAQSEVDLFEPEVLKAIGQP